MNRKAIVGTVVSIGCLAGVGAMVDLTATKQAIMATDYRLVGAASAAAGIGYWLRSLRFWLLTTQASIAKTFGPRAAFASTSIGAFVSSVLPARLGELTRVLVVASHYGTGYPRALAGTILDRLCDALLLLTMIGACLLTVPRSMPAWVVSAATSCGYLVVALLLLLAGASVGHRRTRRLIAWVTARLPARLGGAAARLADGLFAAFTDPSIGRRLALSLLISAVAWLVELAIVAMLADAVGSALGWPDLLFIFVGMSLATALPSAPAGIGPVQFAALVTYEAVAGERDHGVAFGALYQLIIFLPIVPIGAYFLAREGLSFSALRSQLRASSEGSGP
jgi:uncharacterized protein (TIRG00374 family)